MTFGLVLGLAVGGALLIFARAFSSPATISLNDALERVHSDRRVEVERRGRRRRDRLGDTIIDNRTVAQGLSFVDADIEVCGLTPEAFLADMVGRFGVGIVGGLGGWWIFGLAGWNLPLGICLGAGVILGCLIAVTAIIDLRNKANVRRAEFLEAMTAFIEFVRLGSTFRPIEGAVAAGVALGVGWPFDVLAATVADSNRYREPIWDGLGRLGRLYELHDLEELASTLSMSQNEGAALAVTLSARSASLRSRVLAQELSAANSATAQLEAPVSLLAVLIFLFLIYPAISVLSGT